MQSLKARLILIVALCLLCRQPCQGLEAADLILTNAEVYTMEPDQPWASTVVITGNEITAVLNKAEAIDTWKGPGTRIVDLQGQFVVPGFIDGHVHFNGAGGFINGTNLLKVSDREGLRAEMKRVVAILDDGEWITGGILGAYEQWADGATGSHEKKKKAWEPNRGMIDDLTPDNPCLLNNFNSKLYLANTQALKAAGLETASLAGMALDNQGLPTGLIHGGSPALGKIRNKVKSKSHKRMMDENRAALKALREAGIVEIHDIAQPNQTRRFVKLQDNGELTCRVWLRPDLSRAPEMKEKGFTMGLNPKTKQPDPWLRYGAFKGYIDGIMGNHGALFYEPYDDQPDNYGGYRHHTSDDPEHKIPNMDKIYNLIKIGYSAGFVSNVHAIGTKGIALMLDTYEQLMNDLGRDLDGFRIIHAQVVRPQDLPRFKKLNVIAEVNPYHVSDDMRWMEERIGHERCKGAYAWQRLLDTEARIAFGTDWPVEPLDPLEGLYAAVTRKDRASKPGDGWFPDQKLSMEKAIELYTLGSAYAEFTEDRIYANAGRRI